MTRHNVGNNPCIVIVGESKLLLQQMIDGRLFHLFMLPDWDVKVTVQMASMGIDQCLKLTKLVNMLYFRAKKTLKRASALTNPI